MNDLKRCVIKYTVLFLDETFVLLLKLRVSSIYVLVMTWTSLQTVTGPILYTRLRSRSINTIR